MFLILVGFLESENIVARTLATVTWNRECFPPTWQRKPQEISELKLAIFPWNLGYHCHIPTNFTDFGLKIFSLQSWMLLLDVIIFIMLNGTLVPSWWCFFSFHLGFLLGSFLFVSINQFLNLKKIERKIL